MKQQEIEKLSQLDPNGINGTIMQTLLHPKVNEIPYADALYHLLSKTLDEKAYFERTTNAMMSVLNSHNLFDEINWALELEEK